MHLLQKKKIQIEISILILLKRILKKKATIRGESFLKIHAKV